MTQPTGKRNVFLAVIALLVAAIVVVSVFILLQGPRESPVEVVGQKGDKLEINDMYDGKMEIPQYDVAKSQYKPDDFKEENGIITYTGGDYWMGIQANSQMGEIDWGQVAASGVDFAMIRVGFRGEDQGDIQLDKQFAANIAGAKEAGIPVGVYFYSKAISDAEAQEEASFVLEQIREKSVTYPLAIVWEYSRKKDGTIDPDKRTVRCNGDQVTGFIETFCKKVSAAGYPASFYANKEMGYQYLNLSRLKSYDMWYAEARPAPSFHYDFKLWQYTKEGTVPGIGTEVPITLALKKYEN